MEVKIMYGAGLFFLGWLWFYLFMRQILFNVFTAFPLIRKMNALQKDLIAVGAVRYTVVSLIVCLLIAAGLLALMIWLCPVYMEISFAVGALLCLLLLIRQIGPSNRPMFDTFCTAYYRFVPDDELRTAMYNKKTGQIKIRLRAMGLEGSFVPEFKKEK